MTQEENIAVQISCLLDQGTLAKSRCSASLVEVLRPLLQAGVIVEERSGAGRSLVVRDVEALRQFSDRAFPNAFVQPGLGSRVTGVARFRDSKIFSSDTPEIVLTRAWSESALTQGDQATEAVPATRRHGVFSFLLRSDNAYALHGACALVENPVIFGCLEKLALPVGLVLYGGGRASNRLLAWLAAMTAPDFTLLHLPDYDPVGLGEFVRLRASLGDRVLLHTPVDLAERFSRFSNPALLRAPNSRAMLANLRQSALPEVQRVLAIIEAHNAGLEQEALLL